MTPTRAQALLLLTEGCTASPQGTAIYELILVFFLVCLFSLHCFALYLNSLLRTSTLEQMSLLLVLRTGPGYVYINDSTAIVKTKDRSPPSIASGPIQWKHGHPRAQYGVWAWPYLYSSSSSSSQ
ncbi:hypothetical protein V8C37DRAFT_383954 [Trichoderma ceciliae]